MKSAARSILKVWSRRWNRNFDGDQIRTVFDPVDGDSDRDLGELFLPLSFEDLRDRSAMVEMERSSESVYGPPL